MALDVLVIALKGSHSNRARHQFWPSLRVEGCEQVKLVLAGYMRHYRACHDGPHSFFNYL